MKILHSDLKHGKVKLQVENLDDLWYLGNIIDISDILKGKTLRKIKLGKEGDRSQSIIKKPVFIAIKVTSLEFSENQGMLRVSGTITEGPDDISRGTYHTFSLEPNTIFTLIKDNWLSFQRDKLKEASQQKPSKILIVVFDREEASIALMKKYGFDILTELRGAVQKKAELTVAKGDFYANITKAIQDYSARLKLNNIILASPAFFKDDLMKQLKDEELKKKIVLATCNNIGVNGINEVLRRPEVKEVLNQDRIAKESELVEQLQVEISKDNLAAYGLKETKTAAEAGAISILLVTDKLIKDMRAKNKYAELDYIMRIVDSSKGQIHVISSEHEAGNKLDGLGGIGAILRYKLNY